MLHNHTIVDIFTPSKTKTEGEEMKYQNYMVIVRFEGDSENTVFNDIVAIDQNAAHADIVEAYGNCELVGFKP